MKKLVYLIVVIVALGLIVAGCLPVVPPAEQNETSNLKSDPTVTVELKDSGGIPLEGALVEFRGKPDSPTEWSFFGTTGVDGKATKDLTASKWEYWFSVKYNDTYAKIKQDIGVDTTVSFTTTSVTLGFSGDITYNSKVEPGTWILFEEPSMEMLPATYAFRFGGDDYPWASVEIEVSGDSVEKTVAYIRLLNSDGTRQTNYTADWCKHGAKPWARVAGTPDANGVLLNVMDGYNDTHYAYHYVQYLNTQSSTLSQIPALDSFYDYRLTNVEVQLRDHAGNLISGTGPKVYSYTHISRPEGEIEFGTLEDGTVSRDLLQGVAFNYFTIKDYNGTSQTIRQLDLADPIVFQTFLVEDNGWGCTDYKRHNQPWQPFPILDGQIELLPANVYIYFRNSDNVVKRFLVLIGGQTLDLFTGLVTP